MRSPIYSIVVPVYKTEAYIKACVESILNQEGDIPFELILVDNGSPDRAGEICEAYAAKDQRVRVIHQENRLPGGGRNAGLKVAQGEYVFFSDSDDLVEPNLLVTLESKRKEQPDIMVFDFYFCDVKNKKHKMSLKVVPKGESGNTWLKLSEESKSFPPQTPWCYAFKRQFLLENSLTYREDIVAVQDLEFNMRAIPLAESVVGISTPLYNWQYRESSVTHTKPQKGSDSHIPQTIAVVAELYRNRPSSLLAMLFVDYASMVGCYPKDSVREIEQMILCNIDIYKQVPPSNQKLAVILTDIFGVYYGAKFYHGIKRMREKSVLLRKINWK